jgi:hypothetical protein
MQEQQREQGALLAPAQRHRPALGEDLERPEDAELHWRSRRTYSRRAAPAKRYGRPVTAPSPVSCGGAPAGPHRQGNDAHRRAPHSALAAWSSAKVCALTSELAKTQPKAGDGCSWCGQCASAFPASSARLGNGLGCGCLGGAARSGSGFEGVGPALGRAGRAPGTVPGHAPSVCTTAPAGPAFQTGSDADRRGRRPRYSCGRPVSRSMSAGHGVREVSTLTLGIATSQRGATPVVQSCRRRASALQTTETFEGGRCVRPLRAGGRPDPGIPISPGCAASQRPDHRSGPNAQPHARRCVDVVDSARPDFRHTTGPRTVLRALSPRRGNPPDRSRGS